MRERQLYNTARTSAGVQQEYNSYIRYSLLILFINTNMNTHCNRIATPYNLFFSYQRLYTGISLRAGGGMLAAPGRVPILSHGALEISAGAGLFCVHGKGPNYITT